MPQRWLVTGNSRGIGRALSEAVLDAGHRMVATAREPAHLADLTERYGDAIRTVALDVTDPAAAQAAVRVAVDSFGGLDVLVNMPAMATSTQSRIWTWTISAGRSKRTCSGRSS